MNLINLFRRAGMDGTTEGMAAVARQATGFTCPTLDPTDEDNPTLTQGVLETIADALLAGAPRDRAASAAGISPAMLRRWIEKGQRDADAGCESNEWLLYLTVSNAELIVIQMLQGLLFQAAAAGDWKAGRAVLQDVYRFGKDEPAQLPDVKEKDDRDKIRARLLATLPEYALEDAEEIPAIPVREGEGEDG